MFPTWRQSLFVIALAAAPAIVRAQSTAVRRGLTTRLRVDSSLVARAAQQRARQIVTSPGTGAATSAAHEAASSAASTLVPPQTAGRITSVRRTDIEALLGAPAAKLRLSRPNGLEPVSTADTLHIASGDFVFRKTNDTATRLSKMPTGPTLVANAGSKYQMPYRWLTIDTTGRPQLLVPYFVLLGGQLTYDVSARTYRGLALIGVEDTLHESMGPQSLVRPLKLLLATTRGGTITPVQLAIAHTGLAYDSVAIESPDSTNVQIRTGADPEGIIIPIMAAAPRVDLVPQQRTIQAFGLATTQVLVTLPRGMGRNDTAQVTFSSSSAAVRPSALTVIGSATPNVTVRSGAPGVDSITVFLDGVPAGMVAINFAAPWTFLSAALAGILLGGLAVFFGDKKRRPVRMLGQSIIKGAPFGFLVAVASAIGLDWLNLKLDDSGTWAAVMVIAALGAWLGRRILDSVFPIEATE